MHCSEHCAAWTGIHQLLPVLFEQTVGQDSLLSQWESAADQQQSTALQVLIDERSSEFRGLDGGHGSHLGAGDDQDQRQQ
jgi:hypothetical protein